MTVGLGRTRNRHTCNRDMRPSSPSSFSVPLGYRAPQQAPTEPGFEPAQAQIRLRAMKIAAEPMVQHYQLRRKSDIVTLCYFGQTKAEHSYAAQHTYAASKGNRPIRASARRQGTFHLPAGNVVPFCSGLAIPTTAVHLRHVAGVQAHLFEKRSSPQWSAAPACGAPRPTAHTDTFRYILELPRVCARRRSRSPSRPYGGDSSRGPFPGASRERVPAADTRPFPRSDAGPHAWPDGAFRQAGRTARPGRRRLPRRPLDALVRRWVAAAGRALRRRTGGAPPPLHATGWPRRGRGVPNPNPVANRSP